MKRWSLLAGLVAVLAAVVYVSTASAAPIPGAHFEKGTWPSGGYLDQLSIGTNAGPGLTGLGCAWVPHDDWIPPTEAATSNLTAAYQGWYGPIQEDLSQQVLIRAKVSGTVEDAAGNTYNLRGSFLDNTTHEDFANDLIFAGVNPARVTLSGPAGTIVGTATFSYVTAPPYWGFTFTSIKRCDLTS